MIFEINLLGIILILVSGFLYFLMLAGLSMIYLKPLKKIYLKIKTRNRLKVRSKLFRKETRIEEHIRKVLSATVKKPMEPQQFIFVHLSLFMSIVLIGVKNVSFPSAILMGGLISGMPYMLLRVKLETTRRKGSFEGERLISEFLSQYRISGCNIYRTIEKIVMDSEGTKISGRLLFKLLLEIRNTGNKAVIQEAADRFAYGIHTNWSRMLANNIKMAAESGTNVTLALEDILIQLREARAMAEERRRLNSEAARIVVFLIPIMYLATVITSIQYLDISPVKFIRNQVYTPQGFLFLLITLFLFLLNLALIEIVSNQRFDY